jgi:hypothetical protein
VAPAARYRHGVAHHALPFRGIPPDRDKYVLGQSVNFDPARWRTNLDDLWPPELDLCPSIPNADRAYVSRRDVFAIGRSATDLTGAAHTYVAAAVWGSGTNARSRFRCLKVFPDDAQRRTEASQLIAKAVKLLLAPSGGPAAAYDALLHVPSIGPSFGTKVLYFAGYDRTPGPRQPLILDRNVAIALSRLCDADWHTTGWTRQEYSEYLDLAHAWADAWHTQPDVIERVLFAIGKSDRLATAALSGQPLR